MKQTLASALETPRDINGNTLSLRRQNSIKSNPILPECNFCNCVTQRPKTSCIFAKCNHVDTSFVTHDATKLQKLHGAQVPELHRCNSSKPRRYAVRRCFLNLRFGVQLKMGKSIRGGDTLRVVSIADTAVLRYRFSHFFAMQKSPYEELTPLGFITVPRTIMKLLLRECSTLSLRKNAAHFSYSVWCEKQTNHDTHHTSSLSRVTHSSVNLLTIYSIVSAANKKPKHLPSPAPSRFFKLYLRYTHGHSNNNDNVRSLVHEHKARRHTLLQKSLPYVVCRDIDVCHTSQ